MNHIGERHLDGTALLKDKGRGVHEGLGRPDLLITGTDKVQWKNPKKKDANRTLLSSSLSPSLTVPRPQLTSPFRPFPPQTSSL